MTSLIIPTLIFAVIAFAIFFGVFALEVWLMEVVYRWVNRKIDHEK